MAPLLPRIQRGRRGREEREREQVGKRELEYIRDRGVNLMLVGEEEVAITRRRGDCEGEV